MTMAFESPGIVPEGLMIGIVDRGTNLDLERNVSASIRHGRRFATLLQQRSQELPAYWL